MQGLLVHNQKSQRHPDNGYMGCVKLSEQRQVPVTHILSITE